MEDDLLKLVYEVDRLRNEVSGLTLALEEHRSENERLAADAAQMKVRAGELQNAVDRAAKMLSPFAEKEIGHHRLPRRLRKASTLAEPLPQH